MCGATISTRKRMLSMCWFPDSAPGLTGISTTSLFTPTEVLAMPSKFLNLARKSYGFRLVVWYFVIFVIGFLSVSIVSYLFLSSSLRDNRKAIQTKLEELISLGQRSGVDAIKHAADGQTPSRRTAFFVRILNRENQLVFLNLPRLWTKFDVASVVIRPVEGAWQYTTAKGDGDVLEMT